MTSTIDLTGRTALITGGSRGLGLAIARGFAAAGANLVIASRKQDACIQAAEQITAEYDVKTWAFGCNVSSWDECTELAETADEQTGGIDVLVNNAGVSPLYPSLGGLSEALYDKVFAVNSKGPFRLATVLGEKMTARGRGSIINISSIESLHPTKHAVPYAAAKSALNAMTQGLALAFGPKVRVNAIVPGAFLTDISAAWDMEAINAIAERSVIMQRCGDPTEIVGAALYFASDLSGYTTATLLRVDGGVVGGLV